MNEQLSLAAPRARKSDPVTAHLAASVVKPANEDLVQAIRRWVWAHGASSHEEIAIGLVPDESVSRWRRSTVVTACARAGLTNCGMDVNRRGRHVTLWGVTTESMKSL